jgi:hypothetical protein
MWSCTFSGKTSKLEKIAATVFTTLISFAMLGGIAMLVTIPREYSIGAPANLSCEFLSLSRRGWGCGVLGGYIKMPIVVGAVFVLTFIVSSSNRLISSGLAAFVFIFSILGASVTALAGFIRIIYYIQGHVSFEYLIISCVLLIQGLCVFLILAYKS